MIYQLPTADAAETAHSQRTTDAATALSGLSFYSSFAVTATALWAATADATATVFWADATMDADARFSSFSSYCSPAAATTTTKTKYYFLPEGDDI